jgi:hypothetical protein
MRRIMPASEIARTGAAIFVGSLLLATLAVFVAGLGLDEAIAGVGWVLSSAAEPRVAVLLLPLFKVSVGSGLMLATLACAASLADLRRQRWL